MLEIGIVTDEVSRELPVALDLIAEWGIQRIELREGERARFPQFAPEEISRVEAAIAAGCNVTAVSPGICKGHVADEAALNGELSQTLPRSIELAQRLEAPIIIIFGFERYEGEPDGDRLRVLRAFEHIAEAVDAAGLIAAVENEPNFWVDRPTETAALIEELDHPALRVNWDPANVRWGGSELHEELFLPIAPYLVNLHAKDLKAKTRNPDTFDANPWRPFGEGLMPWPEVLEWVNEHTDIAHITLETHCEPLIASSLKGLDNLRKLL